jgi:hypothetical protein
VARSNAARFACEGALNPLSLRTNCKEAARISSSVAGGAKLKSVLMFLHLGQGYQVAAMASTSSFQRGSNS